MTFQKGKSGNPGGRPKVAPAVREALEALTMPAVLVLAEALKSEDLRLAKDTALAILERNLGKVATPVELGGADGAPLGITVAFVKAAKKAV